MLAANFYGRILLALVYSWGMFVYADSINHACQATNGFCLYLVAYFTNASNFIGRQLLSTHLFWCVAKSAYRQSDLSCATSCFLFKCSFGQIYRLIVQRRSSFSVARVNLAGSSSAISCQATNISNIATSWESEEPSILWFDPSLTRSFLPPAHFSVSTTLCQPGWFILRSPFFRPNKCHSKHRNIMGVLGAVLVRFIVHKFISSFSTMLYQPGWFILRSSLFRANKRHRNIMKVYGAVLIRFIVDNFINIAMLRGSEEPSFCSTHHWQVHSYLRGDFSVSTVLCQPGWFIPRSSLFQPTSTQNTSVQGSPLVYSMHFGQVYLLLRVNFSISATLFQPGRFILRSFISQTRHPSVSYFCYGKAHYVCLPDDIFPESCRKVYWFSLVHAVALGHSARGFK